MNGNLDLPENCMPDSNAEKPCNEVRGQHDVEYRPLQQVQQAKLIKQHVLIAAFCVAKGFQHADLRFYTGEIPGHIMVEQNSGAAVFIPPKSPLTFEGVTFQSLTRSAVLNSNQAKLSAAPATNDRCREWALKEHAPPLRVPPRTASALVDWSRALNQVCLSTPR